MLLNVQAPNPPDNMAAKKSASKASRAAFKKGKMLPEEFFVQSSYGLLVGALGVVWLAQELGWMSSNIPFGPLTITLLGLLIMFSNARKN